MTFGTVAFAPALLVATSAVVVGMGASAPVPSAIPSAIAGDGARGPEKAGNVRPVMAMPTSLVGSVRAIDEECEDTLGDTDNDGANPLHRRSVTLEPLTLPGGRTAIIRCSVTATGRYAFTVRLLGGN